MSVILVGALADAVGNVAANEWDVSREAKANDALNEFFTLYDLEQYRKALEIGIEALIKVPIHSMVRARWLNNLACANAWSGDFITADTFLSEASRVAEGLPRKIILCNLAYIKYHLGAETHRLIPVVNEAIKDFRSYHPRDRWLQMWSRLQDDAKILPPNGTLMRLLIKRGDYAAAFACGEEDIAFQGMAAQGTRILLGLISTPVGRATSALQYLDEVSEAYNPASSWAHMDAERNVVQGFLIGKTPDDVSGFSAQAESVKAGYYAWTGHADVRYCLATPESRTLRVEYGRQIYDGYRKAGKSDLVPLVMMKQLIE